MKANIKLTFLLVCHKYYCMLYNIVYKKTFEILWTLKRLKMDLRLLL